MPQGKALIELEPIGFDELEKNFSHAREEVVITLNRMLRRSGKALLPALKKETPTGARNKLRNTTTYQIMGKGGSQRLEMRQSAFSRNGFPYGAAVRSGTRPHFPPYRELIPWVERKLGVGGLMAPRVAYLIARKISRVGTKKNPYHERAYRSKVGELKHIYNDEVEQLTERLVK